MKKCMGKEKRIQILLSTYNGEKYLREQIDSYLKMEHFDQVSVLIRDDGSTDGTCAILKEFEKREEFDIEYGTNIGITDSFMWLMEHSNKSCSFFAFSDQDDVWLPNKFSLALKKLDKEPQDIPLLFASLSHIVDENLSHIGTSVFPRRGVSYYNAMIQNVLPGHTQVLNRTLVQLILELNCSNVHVFDWWVYLVTSSVGKIIYCDEYTVLHRQHSNNAVGASKGIVQDIIRKLRFIKEGRGNAFSLQLKDFLNRYSNRIPEEYSRETENFFSCMESTGSRLHYVVHCKAYRQGKIENLLFKILYVIGKYNCL